MSGTPAPRRRFAFVHVKGFSSINDSLREALRGSFDLALSLDAFAAVDVARYRPAALANLAVTLATFGLRGRSGSRLLKTPFAYRAMSRYAYRELARRRGEFDLVIQTQTLCEARLPSLPFIIYTDCTLPLARRIYAGWDGPRALERLERETLRRADLIGLHNSAAQESLVGDYGIDPARTLVLGFGMPIPQEPNPPPPRRRQIACVTTDPERHRVNLLRDVFARHVLPDWPDMKLILGGAGTDALTAGPGEQCLGRLDRARLDLLLWETPIYVMPSRAGGASSLLDAMARGCACVAVAGNPFLSPAVVDGETALVAPCGDEGDLAERVRYLLERPDEVKRLGRNAAERVRAECAWEAIGKRFARAIEAAL